MNTNQITSTNNTSKTEPKHTSISNQEGSKPLIQYAADLQDLLFSKMEEYELFRELVKTKLKG